MKGRILAFRQSRRVSNPRYAVVKPSIEGNYIGRKVVYTTLTGKKIAGKVRKHHGNALLVCFSRGLPGLALGSDVEFIPSSKAEEKS
ncbi:50S ribosomal protein L35Ae [archaeon BMS3Bbin15]|nr:50S ribosomal protein L35Ae [archaeon BMS3Bbin15]